MDIRQKLYQSNILFYFLHFTCLHSVLLAKRELSKINQVMKAKRICAIYRLFCLDHLRWSRWNDGFPTPLNNGIRCALLSSVLFDGKNQASFNDISCEEVHPYICMDILPDEYSKCFKMYILIFSHGNNIICISKPRKNTS